MAAHKRTLQVVPEDILRARAGYVEYPGGPLCGNCEYLDGKVCAKFGFAVDPKNGCCDAWEAADNRGKDWQNEIDGIADLDMIVMDMMGPLAKYIPEEEE